MDRSRGHPIWSGAVFKGAPPAQGPTDHRRSKRPFPYQISATGVRPGDEEETTLVVGRWTYAGSGWETEGDAELAKAAAAARAREYAQWRAASRTSH